MAEPVIVPHRPHLRASLQRSLPRAELHPSHYFLKHPPLIYFHLLWPPVSISAPSPHLSKSSSWLHRTVQGWPSTDKISRCSMGELHVKNWRRARAGSWGRPRRQLPRPWLFGGLTSVTDPRYNQSGQMITWILKKLADKTLIKGCLEKYKWEAPGDDGLH